MGLQLLLNFNKVIIESWKNNRQIIHQSYYHHLK